MGMAEGSSRYSKLVNLRKDQRAAQTILKGGRQLVMLLRFREENMKIDLETGRRAKSAEMEGPSGTFEALYGVDGYGGETGAPHVD